MWMELKIIKELNTESADMKVGITVH